MTSSGTATVTLPTDRQILITREFDAPKHLVFKAWTTPDLVRRWWPTDRGEMTVCEIDLRVGGTWRYVMVTETGFEVGFHGEFRELVPDETDRLDRGLRGDPRPRRQRVVEHADADRGGRPHDDDRPGRAPDRRGPRRPHQLGHGGGYAGRTRPAGAGGGLAPLMACAPASLAKPVAQADNARVATTIRATSAVVAPLLERDDALVVLHGALSEVRAGAGRMVLVSGEAGIGKTALVRSFAGSVRGSARVLEGACDALAAPRPLGAFVDLGGDPGDRLRDLVALGVSPHEVFDALADELSGAHVGAGRRGRPLGGRGDARRAARARPADRGGAGAGRRQLPRRRRRCGASGAHAARRPGDGVRAWAASAWSRCPPRRWRRWRPGTSSTRASSTG